MEEDEEEERIKSEINKIREQIHIIERQYEGYKTAIKELRIIDGGENIESLKSGEEETLKALDKLNQTFKDLRAEYVEYKKHQAREREQEKEQNPESSFEGR